MLELELHKILNLHEKRIVYVLSKNKNEKIFYFYERIAL